MSHSIGIVYDFEGEVLGYFEYNGTVDYACSSVRTLEEVESNWRTGAAEVPCNCIKEKRKPKWVLLYSDYGFGFHWPAQICENCKSIIHGTEPCNDIKGYPENAKIRL